MANNGPVNQFAVDVVNTPGLKNIWSTDPGPTTVLYVNASLEWMRNPKIGEIVDEKMNPFYSRSSSDDEDEDEGEDEEDDDEDEDEEDENHDDLFGGQDNPNYLLQPSMFGTSSQFSPSFTAQPSGMPSSSSIDKGKGRAQVNLGSNHSNATPSIASVARQFHSDITAPPYPPSFSYTSALTDPDTYMESPPSEHLPPSSSAAFGYDELDVEMTSPSYEMDAQADVQDAASLVSSSSTNDLMPYTRLQGSRIDLDPAGSTASLLSMASKHSNISLLDPDFNIRHFLHLLVTSPEGAQHYLTTAGTSKSGKHTTVVGEMVGSTRVAMTVYNAAHENGWNRPLDHEVIVENAQFTVLFFTTIMQLYIEETKSQELNCKSNHSMRNWYKSLILPFYQISPGREPWALSSWHH